MASPQLVEVRGKVFFVCDYTGALITKRYFIPCGKDLKKKQGSYASLPILLRAVLEEEHGKYTDRFQKIKQDCEVFFTQPDIPVATRVDEEDLPLSDSDVLNKMRELDMGAAWFYVEGAETAERPKKKVKRSKK